LTDALVGEMVRKGFMSPPRMPFQGPPPSLPVASWAHLEAELERDRSDR
jgi:hypothetical protein